MNGEAQTCRPLIETSVKLLRICGTICSLFFHVKSVSIKETFESFQALFAAVPTDFRQLLVPVKGQKICGIVHYSRRLNGSVASDVVGAHILLGLSPS